jgi:hypothetical protein
MDRRANHPQLDNVRFLTHPPSARLSPHRGVAEIISLRAHRRRKSARQAAAVLFAAAVLSIIVLSMIAIAAYARLPNEGWFIPMIPF